MKHPRLVAIGTALAILALPSSAAANDEPSPKTVRAHVVSADQALDMVAAYVGQHDLAAAAIEFARNRQETAAALADAGQLRYVAPRARRAQWRAYAERYIARLQNANVENLVDLLDEVTGELQEDIAEAIPAALESRERALAALRRLLDRVPADVQEVISGVIARLSTDLKDEIADLTDVMQGVELPVNVRDILGDVLEIASDAVQSGLDRLESIVTVLPGFVRPIVEQAINIVQAQIPHVMDMIRDLLGGLAPPTDGGETPPTDGGEEPPTDGGSSGGGFLDGILSGLPLPQFVRDILGIFRF